MSKLTTIKEKILQLEGGAFQELCDEYLSRKGYEGIFELGMKSGTIKTTIGNPDTYFKSKSGKYIFVAYTTQISNVNSKIKEDIEKCLDKTKTGVDVLDIEEIICCHTSSTLNAGKDKEFRDMCAEKGILLNLFGVDCLANEIFIHYKSLAKNHLGIEIDTNQISDECEFIRRYDANEMAAPLSTDFQFRENEFKNIVESLLQNKVTVIFGKAGAGKTRLALETGRVFSKENGFRFLCIRSNDLPIFQDLSDYIMKPDKYLLFVDDANELSGLKHVLEYLNMHKNGYEIRIMITVRDYAKNRVLNEIKEFALPEKIEINPFSDKEIKGFLKTNLEISNDFFVEKIIKIAEGNPRIAYLAGKLAKETQSLESIQDATQLYDAYYGKYIGNNLVGTDKKVCISAGIISLLKTVNLEYIENLLPILNYAKITEDEFIKNLELLHSLELVDIHFDKIVKISDQCLGNYLLFYSFIEKKQILFSDLLKFCFKNFRMSIIVGTSTLLNIFNSENTENYILEEITKVWNDLQKENDELFFEFVKVFKNTKPVEALLYSENLIKRSPIIKKELKELNFDKNSNNVQDNIVSLLTGYRHNEFISEALELLILYGKKRQDVIPEILNAITSYYSIDKYSYKNDYYTQIKVADAFANHVEEDEVMEFLFVRISKELLKLKFSPSESGRGNTISIYTIPVYLTNGSKRYRALLWEKLISLSMKEKHQEEILKLIDEYSIGWADEVGTEILKFDIFYIEKIIMNLRGMKSFLVAKSYRQLIDKFENNLVVHEWLNKSVFDDKEWQTYSIMTNWHHRGEMTYEEEEEKKRVEILEFLKKLSKDSLSDFFTSCNTFVEKLPNESWEINNNLNKLCEAISNQSEMFLCFIEKYFIVGQSLDLFPNKVILQLFKFKGIEETFTYLNSKEFQQKNAWLFSFFEVLPEESVNEKWINELYNFLSDNSDKELKSSYNRNLKFLNKFIHIEKNIYVKVSKIINGKICYNPFVASLYFGLLFNPHVNKPEEILDLYELDIPLLQDIYWNMLKQSINFDYSGEFLVEFVKKDISWLKLYVKFLLEKIKDWRYDDSRLNKLWMIDDYEEIFDYVFYELEQKEDLFNWRIENIFKHILTRRENETEKLDRQINWLKHLISNNCKTDKIIAIFEMISETGSIIRKECILYFIENNESYEMFCKLELEPNQWGGVGSMEERIKFYESLLPDFTGLKFLKHKKLILEKIDMWRRRIKDEQIEEILRERYM